MRGVSGTGGGRRYLHNRAARSKLTVKQQSRCDTHEVTNMHTAATMIDEIVKTAQELAAMTDADGQLEHTKHVTSDLMLSLLYLQRARAYARPRTHTHIWGN